MALNANVLKDKIIQKVELKIGQQIPESWLPFLEAIAEAVVEEIQANAVVNGTVIE